SRSSTGRSARRGASRGPPEVAVRQRRGSAGGAVAPAPLAPPPPVDSPVEASAADRATAQLAKVVASARRTAGLTLAATAAGSGLSPAYVSQIESGSANPTVRSLAQLAGVLGLELHELLGAGPGD
ncbi:helix-turn-helix domain-containing protein, partial [Streptomyces sp. NRRL B-3253]|uniref:helix-turn-helix domain-containing protein n=1 Tax=Streptomyces sp. NRRL B-3253 TaxID=1463837 RepID=UPI001F29DF5C